MRGTALGADAQVITAWSAVSAFGAGRAAFAAGLDAGRQAAADLAASEWDVPDARACLVPGFDLATEVGPKGIRAMDRGTGLALSAVGRLLEDLGPDAGVGAREDTGLVLGTTFGSTETMMEFTRASLTGKRPFYVDPAMMPYAVMNATAGQCAIRHRLQGPNTTLTGGRTSMLLGLRYARRLLANGRAGRVLVGAVEEYSRARSWLRHVDPERGPDEAEWPLGEGALMLLVEPADAVGADRRPLAEVLAVRTRIFAGDDPAPQLRQCVADVLAEAGVDVRDVALVAVSDAPGRLAERERQAVVAVVGGEADVLPCLPALLGETACVSSAFQIGAVLCAAAADPVRLAGRIALVTCVDRDGSVASALLRLGHAR